MKKISKLFAVLLTLILIGSTLTACGGGKKTKETANEDESTKTEENKDESSNGQSANNDEKVDEIYYLNFKPEIAEVYNEIAADYEAETGIKVKVVTAASGTYDQTLKSEIAKSDPPTIFQMNGPVGYQSWKDYCLDLKDTDLYNFLSDKMVYMVFHM
jgi:raffinose/stachyose/melibiose transport system substrate-binding protein